MYCTVYPASACTTNTFTSLYAYDYDYFLSFSFFRISHCNCVLFVRAAFRDICAAIGLAIDF